MDAKKIEVLLEAIETGSLMGAAERNGYTPSGLSHLLHRLEDELGVPLALRTNRGIELSEAGETLLPYLKAYAESFRTLEAEAAKLSGRQEAVLHIGAYASIAKSYLPPLLQAFGREYPQIRVELEVLSRQELYRAMKEGKLRVIFACEDKQQHYRFLHLADDPFFAVLPQSDDMLRAITVKSKKNECSGNTEMPQADTADTLSSADVIGKGECEGGFAIENFEHFPFIMPSYGEDVEVHELFEQYGVQPKLLPASADDPVILGMVAGGMGVSMLSELVLSGSGENVRKVPIKPYAYRDLGIVYREPSRLSESERRFLKFAEGFFKEL